MLVEKAQVGDPVLVPEEAVARVVLRGAEGLNALNAAVRAGAVAAKKNSSRWMLRRIHLKTLQCLRVRLLLSELLVHLISDQGSIGQ